MKLFKKASLKYRILFIFTAITVLLVSIMAQVSYQSVKDNYLQQAGLHVKMLTTYMAGSLDQKYLDFITTDKTKQVNEIYFKFLQEEVSKSNVENAFIFNKELKVVSFAKDGISSAQLKINQNEILILAPKESSYSFPFSDESGQWYVWGFYRLSDNYFLGIQENAERLETLNQLSSIFWGIGLAGVILTLIAGWFIAQSITEPVDKLVEYSKQIGSGNFDVKSPSNIEGEFEILRNSMQQMQSNLAAHNKEREQMLAQIAHEIRNPLGGIELLSGLVKEKLDEEDPSQLHLKKIIEEVHGLKSQLTLFLEYSKPQQVNKQNVDLRNLLKEINDNFSQEIKMKKIDFKMNIEKDSIYFDIGHLKQTLINLVANSLDAVNGNGEITFSSIQQGAASILEITDNGPGIEESNMKKVFSPFYTTKANGTGLGLAICQKLCYANNAVLSVKNNNQSGCTFSLKIM